MENPAKPGGADPSKSSWEEDSGSEGSFGATGVFGQVKDGGPAKSPASGGPSPFDFRSEAPAMPPPPAIPGGLTEPVVHKVVLGSEAERSPDVLDRMRAASEERKSAPPVVPGWEAVPPAAASGGGFTQLLRTLESDFPAPAKPAGQSVFLETPRPIPEAPRPTPESPRPLQDSGGFTSLLRTLGSEDSGGAASQAPATGRQPETFAFREDTQRPTPSVSFSAAAAPGFKETTAAKPGAPGSFTQLFSALGDEGASKPAATPSFSSAPTPNFNEPPAAKANTPGTFTQLFSSIGSEGSSAPAATPSFNAAPMPSFKETPAAKESAPGAFTQLFSSIGNEGSSAPAAEPPFAQSSRPASFTEALRSASRDSFSPPPTQTLPPAPSGTPGGGGAGLTQLIRMLDEPVKPVENAGGMQAGGPSGTPAPQTAAPSAPLDKTGASEYSRIIDASKMREIAMRGNQGAGGAAPPPAAPPPPPAPSYQMPGVPYPQMPAMGGMPPYGAPPMPPPQAPNPAMNFGGGGGAMPGYGGMPQMQAPAYPPPPPMPVVAAPAPPAAPAPAAPAAGKMQQFVPLLLILIIFLLLGVLVTVIFLLKH